ncbi:MAG: hypothetical protein MMC33_003858 [Icmadophila ericetorum]|nr:hypothetical protein [Icmadophila ericetorum]
MAPVSLSEATNLVVDQIPTKVANGVHGEPSYSSTLKKPLKLQGLLDRYKSFDVTPVIGKEFQDVDLVEWLKAPNSDELLRELAVTSGSMSTPPLRKVLIMHSAVSQRGVVFFRAQDALTDDLQKELVHRLGQLTGKPESSGLHIHPVTNSSQELGGKDDEISIISSVQAKKIFKNFGLLTKKRQTGKGEWHSDITFEPVPSDYTLLRLTQLPTTGGDTLWASGYELYDRISAPYQKFLETLTATYAQPRFNEAARDANFKLFSEPRGSPLNVGEDLTATHPVIRTNPVTGWKSVFAVGQHVQSIDDLTPLESRALLDWFVQLIMDNHDLQVRYRWQNRNDVAIWDNRSVYHAATPDYAGLGERLGHRAVGLGEKPYLDPGSKSRREALSGEGITALTENGNGGDHKVNS